MDEQLHGRYFLFGVPCVDDGQLRVALGEYIRYYEGIHEINWVRPADYLDGVVRLELDDQAAQLLLHHPGNLEINGTIVTFADSQQLLTNVRSTIDDDVLQLVKQHLSTVETSVSFDELAQNVKFTKFRHADGHDCWRVDGTLADVKRFEDHISKLLFGETYAHRNLKKKTAKTKKAKGARRGKRNSPPDENSHDDGKSLPFTGGVVHSEYKQPSSSGKVVFRTHSDPPLLFEFYVGDLCKDEGVEAVVNPTNAMLEPTANYLCHAMSDAMGPINYEVLRLETIDTVGWPRETGAIITSAGGSLPFKYIIHIALPSDWSKDEQELTTTLDACYEDILTTAKHHGVLSLSMPLLGLESGVSIEQATTGALLTLLNAVVDLSWSLSKYMQLIRIVFNNETDMNYFVANFSTYFDSACERVIEDARNEQKTKLSGRPGHKPSKVPHCQICLEEFVIGSKMSQPECGHEFHTICLGQWFNVKKTCPACDAEGKR